MVPGMGSALGLASAHVDTPVGPVLTEVAVIAFPNEPHVSLECNYKSWLTPVLESNSAPS